MCYNIHIIHSAVQEDDERVCQFHQCYLSLFVTLCAVMRYLPLLHCRVQISNLQLALDVSWVGPVAVMAAMDVATISPSDAKLQVDPDINFAMSCRCRVYYSIMY